jgi:protein TonB
MFSDTYPASSLWTDPCTVGESLPRRCLRFLVVLGAHVAVIAGGVELASRPEVRQAVEQIYVRLVEAPPPKALPVAQEVKPMPVERKPVVRKPEPPPPILTAAAEAPSTSGFAVAPQPPAPPVAAPLQAAPQPAPQAVTAARFDADYLHNPKPVYPTVSRRRAEEGTVLLRVRVSAEGAALAVELRNSSGYPRLDEAAQDAVRRWRFVPARQGSEAIESWVAVPIAFKLES